MGLNTTLCLCFACTTLGLNTTLCLCFACTTLLAFGVVYHRQRRSHSVPFDPITYLIQSASTARFFFLRHLPRSPSAVLSHAPAGLFQPLDDFLRTSNVGEFFARLQMVRAFAAQLGSASSSTGGSGNALGTVLQGLWHYYSQVNLSASSVHVVVVAYFFCLVAVPNTWARSLSPP